MILKRSHTMSNTFSDVSLSEVIKSSLETSVLSKDEARKYFQLEATREPFVFTSAHPAISTDGLPRKLFILRCFDSGNFEYVFVDKEYITDTDRQLFNQFIYLSQALINDPRCSPADIFKAIPYDTKFHADLPSIPKSLQRTIPYSNLGMALAHHFRSLFQFKTAKVPGSPSVDNDPVVPYYTFLPCYLDIGQ